MDEWKQGEYYWGLFTPFAGGYDLTIQVNSSTRDLTRFNYQGIWRNIGYKNVIMTFFEKNAPSVKKNKSIHAILWLKITEKILPKLVPFGRFLTPTLLHGPIWSWMLFYNFSSSTRWLFQIFFSKNVIMTCFISNPYHLNVSINPSAPTAQIWANFVFEDRLLSPGLTYEPSEGIKIKPDRFST